MRAASLLLAACIVVTAAGPAAADSLDELARAVEAHPDDAAAYDAYALAAFGQKRYDDAIAKLKIGVARIPSYGEGYYKLAYAYRQKREWADAADYYRRYIALYPDKTDPYFGLGASLEGLGDKRGAADAYRKYIALETSPQKARFVSEAKQELAKLTAPAEAAPALAQPSAPTEAPRADAAALKATADGLRKSGQLAEAAPAYRKAIEADPGNVELYNDLGNVDFALKRYPDAAQAFREAVTRDPNFALGWYNLAHAERKGGQGAEAVTAYRRYITLRPADPDPYYGLGQALKGEGDVPGAIDAFEKYIAMEKRPSEQRWVDKAKAELDALKTMQKPAPTSAPHSDEGPVPVSTRAISFNDDDLINPFPKAESGRVDESELRDPFAERAHPLSLSGSRARRLREFGRALLAYRRALARHAEDVSERYDRGIGFVLSDNGSAALSAWSGVQIDDPRVEEARQNLLRARRLLAGR